MNRKTPIIAGAILSFMLILSACGGKTASTTTPNASPVQEKTYRIGLLASPTPGNVWGINALPTYWDLAVQSPMRLTLFGLTDQRFQLVPQVAADFATSLEQEGDTWVSTVPIRKGILWSDGKPLTAKDVAFTLDTALRFGLAGGNWSAWADGDYLQDVQAPDDNTVKFVYHAKPGMARHEWGSLQAAVACEHFWAPLVEEAAAGLAGLTRPAAGASEEEVQAFTAKQTEAAEKLFALPAAGEPLAGAFLFSRQEEGSYLELAANKDYFFSGVTFTEYASGSYREYKAGAYDFQAYGAPEGEKTLEYTGGPFVDKVVYSIYFDLNAAMLALKGGEIDTILNPQGFPLGMAESAEEDPNLTVVKNPSLAFRFLAFNTRRAPMGDSAFRRAVATLIDREFVTRTILQGIAYPVYSFVPEANAEWYKADLPRLGFLPDGTAMSREQRINKAVEFLGAAGYTWTGGRIPAWDPQNLMVVPGGTLILPGGTPMTSLELLAPSYGYDPLRATFAIWIAQWLNEFGIPVQVRLLGPNLLVARVFQDQDFDMFVLGTSAGLFPSYLRDYWHSSQSVPGGKNAGGYSNARFDSLSDQLLQCDSFATCKPIADQIQLLIADDAPWIPLFDTGIYEILNKKLKFPYTQTLGGLQYFYGMPAMVQVD